MMDQSASQPGHMTDLLLRINTVETQVKQVQVQLNQYVPTTVNDLQLQSIRAAVDRIERDIAEMKRQFNELNTKLITQETDAKQRDALQRESQDKLQIRVLQGIVTAIITIFIGVIIGYLTHLIH